MASATTPTFRVTGLQRREVSKLRSFAKHLGLTTEEYLRVIVRDRLAIEREAQRRTFAEIAAPMRRDFRDSGMTEDELDSLVDAARTVAHRRTKG